MRVLNKALPFCLLVALAASLGAQSSRSRAQATLTLAPGEFRHIVEVIAHDSMVGRATPSPQLEVAARFIAERFRTAGLLPLGDDSSYLQRYPVVETLLDPDSVHIRLGSLAFWKFGTDFTHIGGIGDASGELTGRTVIVTGAVTRTNAASLDVSGKVVIFVTQLNAQGRAADVRPLLALLSAGPKAIIFPGGRPDSTWRALSKDPNEFKPGAAAAWPIWTANRGVRENVVHFLPILELWAGRFPDFLRRAAIDSASLWAADGAPRVTPVDVQGDFRFGRRIVDVAWPPNVVGVIEGSDPILKHEYVVFTAHLDGLGRERGGRTGPESVLNGADDDASGVAVIAQLAKAFAASPRRSKRSIMFVAVSGEERGLWGSDYFATHPPVPRTSIVADMNLDMVGRSVSDSIYILGRGSSDIGGIADRALRESRAHGLVVLDEAALERRYPGESLGQRSDLVNFTRRGIPAVHFFTGLHEDYHTTGDDAEKLNYEAMTRIAMVAFDVGIAIGNAHLPTRR